MGIVVGSMLLSLQATTDKLAADLKKANAQIAQFAEQSRAANASLRESVDRNSEAFERMGHRVGRAVGIVGFALRDLGDKGEKEVGETLHLVDKLILGFAAGGPIVGAAIAGITIGLEILQHKQEELNKEQEKSASNAKAVGANWTEAHERLKSLLDKDKKSYELLGEEIDKEKQKIEATSNALDRGFVTPGSKLSFGTKATMEQEIKDREKIVALLGQQIALQQSLEALRLSQIATRADRRMASMDAEFRGQPGNERALMDQIADLSEKRAAFEGISTQEARDQVRELTLEINKLGEVLAKTKEINRARADKANSEQIARERVQVDALKEAIPLEARLNELRTLGGQFDQPEIEALERQLDLLSAQARATEDLLALNQKLEKERLSGVMSPQAIAALEAVEKERIAAEFALATARARIHDIPQLFKDMSSTISSTIADALVDGAETGFKNFGDIARSLLHSLLVSLANDITSTLLRGLSGTLAGVFGGGTSSGGIGGIISAGLSLIGGVGGGGGGGGDIGAGLSLGSGAMDLGGEPDCPT